MLYLNGDYMKKGLQGWGTKTVEVRAGGQISQEALQELEEQTVELSTSMIELDPEIWEEAEMAASISKTATWRVRSIEGGTRPCYLGWLYEPRLMLLIQDILSPALSPAILPKLD